jgi:kynurenine formamidase
MDARCHPLTPHVIDVTREMSHGMPTWPGNKVGVAIERTARLESDGYNLSRFSHLECHCGTHFDSPSHFIDGGTDLAGTPLRVLPAVIISISEKQIGPTIFTPASHLKDHAVLVHTGWDAQIGHSNYYRNFPTLTAQAAQFLVENEIGLLGMDTPSPDPPDSSDHPVHHLLLGAGIPIVEGLVRLDQVRRVKGTPYFLAFPLKVKGVEACPVRAAVLLLTTK